jgi:hypothetical protein
MLQGGTVHSAATFFLPVAVLWDVINTFWVDFF